MINLNKYQLTDHEHQEIIKMLASVGGELNLQSLWALMDEAWVDLGCAERPLAQHCLDAFYRHPVWALNGIFIEQDEESMSHRWAFADVLSTLNPRQVLDVGGGFGTLARIISKRSPDASISILEPYPSQCMIELCSGNNQIRFVDKFEDSFYDILVCTDVLEHVTDPLQLLVKMICSVRVDGYLLIANCFEPVIECHLPSTFHLRYSFDDFCSRLGLRKLDSIDLPYGSMYQKVEFISLQLDLLRRLEAQSQRLYPLKAWSQRWLRPWANRLAKARQEPMHYPRKLAVRLRKW